MTRRLTPEEQALWDRVRATAAPLRPGQPIPAPPKAPAPVPVPAAPQAPVPSAPPLAPFRIGEAVRHRGSHDLLPGLAESLGRLPLRMDAGTHARMRRGKLRPEARLDLHGMTAAEAHPALLSFVQGSRAAGRRLVLVITGKGRPPDPARDELWPMPRRAGRLRHEVPRWLMQPPLRDAVLQVAPAHPRHGGEGALYVYLRAP